MPDEYSHLMWLGFLAMAAVPGYFVLQAWLAQAWSGGWRIAALVPLVVMAPVVLHALFALAIGSNLWPIGVILLAPLAFVYLVVVCSSRAIVNWARV
jgi:hypothetical protein